MSDDPAIDAAERATALLPRMRPPTRGEINAAREALKPVREVWLEWDGEQVLPPEAWQILAAFEPLLFAMDKK